MNKTKSYIGIAAVGLIGLLGCNKSEPPPPPKGSFDPIKLEQAFQDASSEVHTAVDQAVLKARYRQFPEAIAALDSLTSDGSLSDKQKQAITNAIEQIKAKMEAPAPAQ